MLGDLLEKLVKAITDVSDRIGQADEQRHQRIANYFQEIANCLEHSAEQLENNQQTNEQWRTRQWGALIAYAAQLSEFSRDGGEIEENLAEYLSQLLNQIVSQTPTNDDISSLREASGRFEAEANAISLRITRPNGKPPILSRRKFVYPILGAVTAMGLIAGGWVARQHKSSFIPSVKWKMVIFLKKASENLIVYKAPQMICERIKEMTGGDFIIDIDINKSQKISTDDILIQVDSGDIECGYSGIYYTSQKYRPLYFGCAIPFGLSPQEQTAWLLYKKDPNDELTFVQSIYKEIGLNIIPFPGGATGSQMGGWFNKEIKLIADFQNLKMRIPGLGADVLQEFGVKTDEDIFGRPLAIDEIKKNLKDKKIDAAEWIGPYDDLQLELNNVATYYYYPGWWEPSTTFDVQVNTNAWKKLSKEYQAIFKAACLETYTKILAEYDQNNAEALQEIKELGKIKIQPFSEEILKKAEAKTTELLQLYSSDPIFKEVYDEWKNFKSRIRSWTDTSLDWYKFK